MAVASIPLRAPCHVFLPGEVGAHLGFPLLFLVLARADRFRILTGQTVSER
jgi:hypothetical protein